jgi:hypothetical protein
MLNARTIGSEAGNNAQILRGLTATILALQRQELVKILLWNGMFQHLKCRLEDCIIGCASVRLKFIVIPSSDHQFV